MTTGTAGEHCVTENTVSVRSMQLAQHTQWIVLLLSNGNNQDDDFVAKGVTQRGRQQKRERSWSCEDGQFGCQLIDSHKNTIIWCLVLTFSEPLEASSSDKIWNGPLPTSLPSSSDESSLTTSLRFTPLFASG